MNRCDPKRLVLATLAGRKISAAAHLNLVVAEALDIRDCRRPEVSARYRELLSPEALRVLDRRQHQHHVRMHDGRAEQALVHDRRRFEHPHRARIERDRIDEHQEIVPVRAAMVTDRPAAVSSGVAGDRSGAKTLKRSP